MDPSDISKKVKSGEYALSKIDGKSHCWKLFSKIIHSDGTEIFGLVCCSKCLSCIIYKKRDPSGKVIDYGTKNLLGHMKHCNPTASGNMAGTVKSYFQSSTKVDQRTANSIKVAESKLVSGCHLSFNVLDNPNFKSFAQTMIEVGSRYGNVAADSVLYGRKTVREKTLQMVNDLQANIVCNIHKAAKDGAISMVTDMWSDNVVQNSYIEVTFFWVSEHTDSLEWSLKRGMYACKYFPEQKTAENICKSIDETLSQAGLNPETVPVTTDKGSNVVAATAHKIRVDCACHRLHTAIECAWNNCKTACSSLEELDENCRKLVQYVKKTTGIQSQLTITLKQGGATRPWRALVNMMKSIIVNIDDDKCILASALRVRRKEGLISDIDEALLKAVYEVLATAAEVFDTLEFSSTPTIGNVLPSYYLLRGLWSETKSTDLATVRRLKKELVIAIDAKMWTSIIQLHFAATFLDPTLREFRFCSVAKDRQLFRQQAINCIRAFSRPTNQLLSSSVNEDNESTEQLGQISSDGANRAVAVEDISASPAIAGSSGTNITDPNPIPQKLPRLDIFARFRAGAESTNSQSNNQQSQTGSDEELSRFLDQDICRYEDLKGPFVNSDNHHRHDKTEGQGKPSVPISSTTQEAFNPLTWWGAEKYRFPYLSIAAKQILVIQGSSAESERHFSTAGKITRKDRARLHSSTVEAQVLLAEGIKKRLI